MDWIGQVFVGRVVVPPRTGCAHLPAPLYLCAVDERSCSTWGLGCRRICPHHVASRHLPAPDGTATVRHAVSMWASRPPRLQFC
eukprot:363616-Chlamydomonas_euryale.AAC.7